MCARDSVNVRESERQRVCVCVYVCGYLIEKQRQKSEGERPPLKKTEIRKKQFRLCVGN